MTLRKSGAVVAALSVALIAAVPSIATSATTKRQVTLKDIEFKPAKLSIKRGQTVTFKWDDGTTPHNVTSRGKTKFKSSPSKSKGTYRVRLSRAGTYKYVCTIHPGMSGQIVVK